MITTGKFLAAIYGLHRENANAPLVAELDAPSMCELCEACKRTETPIHEDHGKAMLFGVALELAPAGAVVHSAWMGSDHFARQVGSLCRIVADIETGQVWRAFADGHRTALAPEAPHPETRPCPACRGSGRVPVDGP